MTIQTLTSESSPTGLPDLAELARLANQFFSALPGETATADAAARASPDAPRAGEHLSPSVSQATPRSPSDYYFLAERQERGIVVDDRVTAESFGLPGEAALRELLLEPARPAVLAPPEPTAPGGYYFVEDWSHPGREGLTPQLASAPKHGLDIHAIRRDFPLLAERVNGKPLVWLDNAATTQKPQAVIDRLAYFYQHENSNIHRAAHEMAARATEAYEAARDKVAHFIGAASAEEIIFVRGATEAINLVASTWGRQNIRAGDEIVVSHLEHHANIVPWQQLAQQVGASLKVIPVDDDGQIRLDGLRQLLNERTRLVALTQVSNALGTVTPVAEVIAMAHAAGARVLIDGAQSVSHLRVNVAVLDADFFVFSGHKVFAPTGIGVVYGKKALLDEMPPWQGGGNMIADVTFERTLFQPPPNRFEAGTGNIADAIGLGAALDYVSGLGLEAIAAYEHGLLEYATAGLQSIRGLRLIGTAREKTSVLSFVLEGYAPEQVGQALNQEGIAVRSGHHCAQPILRRFGLEATVRPSLAFYNTCEEVDKLVEVVGRLASARR
ncbi:family 2A encapsulin nanocompartment cargo protein cysteine desulfurase [Paludibacterium sp.]|uniref:family 2A encapsulin nanocompartment cargo protein cysteine desulfurase n=1 Tax=Paludibacterium sp. TaxID=1917523 RepID=UPI0025FD4198|nr:family 2A encapsulin nanocompartment cargo protein cysteine desulfurase [Paludibacterium sp.]MBV8648673.1 cysteine desulfurase [Paludibacterium sp.]